MLTLAAPCEVFPAWEQAQREFERRAREASPAPGVLRTIGFLEVELAERVSEWFLAPAAPTDAVRRSYRALERDTARLFRVIQQRLGVQVRYVLTDDEPYDSAAELCAELRERRSMALRSSLCDPPHPLFETIDQLRVIHDVFGHAALGLGFDLQSEFGTWLQCRTLFTREARPAAFCELVGAVTAYVMTGAKPALQAKVPPVELLRAFDADLFAS
jgi:hypothetical protein